MPSSMHEDAETHEGKAAMEIVSNIRPRGSDKRLLIKKVARTVERCDNQIKVIKYGAGNTDLSCFG